MAKMAHAHFVLNLTQAWCKGPLAGSRAHCPLLFAECSPIDDFLGFCPDEMLLLRCQDAQGELLASAALPIHHICALVHVDSALWEGCGLQEQDRQSHSETAEKRQHRWLEDLVIPALSLLVPLPPTHSGRSRAGQGSQRTPG